MSTTIFSVGEEVEVKSLKSWFPATMIRSNQDSNDNVTIKYNPSTPNDVCNSVASVSATLVRPSPPLKRPEFRLGEFVEVFQDSMGWRSARFLGFRQDSTCAILIGGEDKPVNIDCRELRPYLHWIDGSWVKLKIKFGGIQILEKETKWRVGRKVEVRTDEDGYEGAMYAATIVGPVKQKTYLVEYHTIKTEHDLEQPLREVIKEENIRPYPPKIRPKTGRYRKGQGVDVWYHQGWWEGVISRVIGESSYMVYFATTNEELRIRLDCLRPHLDWVDGKWTAPPRKISLHRR